jgi:uncharacterized protein YndB with AHSA1/START domain/mannose-6-phosphate isomerase-like protein (cupin superfamily)
MLDMEPLGLRLRFIGPGEMEVTGRPRGFLDQRHVHPEQTERIEVVSGAMKVTMRGQEHVLREGESIEIPPGTPHTQVPHGHGPGNVRIQVRPPGRTQEFMERVAALCREGQFTRSGFPKPRAAAELVLEYSDAGHAAAPPLRVQQALARLIGGASRPYVFVDEWDVAAPPGAVFDALSDARSYPSWWRPVYLEVEADGPAAIGSVSHQHFKGRLPYHLRTRSVISELDRPSRIVADVDGDLRGRGAWTLTPTARGTHVRFDWQVHADRRLLRVLTPLLRPLLRWNHNWAIARAMEGLEPYAAREAARVAKVA